MFVCQFVSVDVNKSMDMSEWCLEEVWGVFVCGARMCLVGYLIAHPLQGEEFTLF